jgi:hypothetical protein
MMDWKRLLYAAALTRLAISAQLQSPVVTVAPPAFEVASIKGFLSEKCN